MKLWKASSWCVLLIVGLLGSNLRGHAQEANTAAKRSDDSVAAALRELQHEVRELHEAMTAMQEETARSRAETAELRQELAVARQAQHPDAAQVASAGKPESNPSAGPLEGRVGALEETSQLLSGKVDEQYQTKVESASKYRVRLSGIVLLNVFSNRGATDNQDLPTWADPLGPLDSKRNFGATLRQSELGLEVFGPTVAGARTKGNLQVDFSGGAPATFNGANFGLFRLRVATMRMDWGHTSIVAGQDEAFFSPRSPTTFASLAIPGFAAAGNLWGWIPQVRVEHRFDLSERQNLTLQAGILDNVTGDIPRFQFERYPQAGEKSGQPAYAARIAWTRNSSNRPLTLGAATYYQREDWAFNRHVDGWASMIDWDVPLSSRLSLTGEFYRGKAIGGLGGAVDRSVLFNGAFDDPTTRVLGLNTIGGWSQLKIRATSRLEFNGGMGVDNSFGRDLRAFGEASQSFVDAELGQNREVLANFIYRPRSNLLFSSEFRHFRTASTVSNRNTADQVNLMMGILF